MQLVDLIKAERVLDSLKNEKLDIQLSYKIMKFLKEIKDDIAFYDAKAKEILNKYSIKDENNELVMKNGLPQPDASKKAEIDKEVDELNKTEVKTPSITFDVREFIGLKLSVQDLMYLDNILKEEE